MNTRLLVLIIVVVLSGCTTYQRYDYNSDIQEFSSSIITINLEGGYDETNLIWGAPYSLQFWIDVPVEKGLSNALVKDITLVGAQDNQKINLGQSRAKKPTVYQSSPHLSQTVASVRLGENGFVYQSYKLKATVVLSFSSNGKSIEEKIEILIELAPSKERHWNWFDEVMSV